MSADNIPRVTICFSKDSDTIKQIDKIRGNMSRSKAFRLLLDYQMEAGTDYVRSILGTSQQT